MEPPVQNQLHSPARLSVARQSRYLLIAAAALVGVALLAVLGHWLFHAEPPPAVILPPGEVRLTDAQMAALGFARARGGGDWQQTDATGEIAADDTLSTPIFMPYSGQVTEVFRQTGDPVQIGQPLLRVRTGDVVDARNALFAANAQRASATAQVALAESNRQRAEAIYRTAGGAYKDYLQAQNDLVTAQSALRNADSAVGAARDKLAIFGKSVGEISQLERSPDISGIHAETVLHAPIAGMIAQRAVAPGQYVTSGGATPVLTIANPARVWLVAQLAESDAPQVHLGDPVDVTVPALPGRIFHAAIDNVAAALDPTTHRLPVRATIANADRALKPEMFANFTIRHRGSDTAHPAGVTIPAMAVIHEGDAARVWVVAGKDLLAARTVTIGDSGNGQVSVLSGLVAGQQVVTTGSIFVNQAGLGE